MLSINHSRENGTFMNSGVYFIFTCWIQLFDGAFKLLNPFVPNAPFFCPLKTSENLTVFWCVQEAEKACTGND